MASNPVYPAQVSVHPELLHTHASRVNDATDVARTFGGRHAGYISECAAAWAGASAEALAELSAHWEASDAQLHGRIGAFSAVIQEGGHRYTAMEDTHAFKFTALRKRSGTS
ncbi:hypothetical protein KV112_06365 [Mycolicibacter sp. MYC123]|uniref:WXG100 family type VII secretion target n=1 Tax=[Mycobacterium] zoologicum TaxID=2872311 RepID=A0ABU5YH30_9MYCO|nr:MULTISPECIES: hypothetical protein [unclassified Mycolicibacter]MEB3049368.1 hypothetical protein [Mycolicibacter sp. MYC123]MEB3062674.1 hypothetical protein [Mycolicibacter sp. MYC101]